MKKIKLFLVLLILCGLAACSSYRPMTAYCKTYDDTKALKERKDYPKLHKKNQFDPSKHYR